MKITKMKKDRIRKLVAWGYFTQKQANESYRTYLKLFKKVQKN